MPSGRTGGWRCVATPSAGGSRIPVLSLVLLGVVLLLSSCGSLRDALPVGIGSGRDELKGSPCACIEIEMREAPDGWRAEMLRQLRTAPRSKAAAA